jgi:hypothetical protein
MSGQPGTRMCTIRHWRRRGGFPENGVGLRADRFAPCVCAGLLAPTLDPDRARPTPGCPPARVRNTATAVAEILLIGGRRFRQPVARETGTAGSDRGHRKREGCAVRGPSYGGSASVRYVEPRTLNEEPDPVGQRELGSPLGV